MITRKDRKKRLRERKKRARRRLALHLAAIGLGLLLLSAGLYAIWTFSPDGLALPIGGGRDAGEPAAADETGESGEADEGRNGVDAGSPDHGDGQTGGTDGEDGFGLDDPWLNTEEEPAVRLLMVGDIMMGGRIAGILEKEGFDYPYRHVGDALKAADLAMGNLESPVTLDGEPADKTWTFRTSPHAVPALKEAGMDVVSLANNHTLDYGVVGLLDTLRYLDEAGIGRVGAGADAKEAYKAHLAEVNGIRIAILGYSHVVPEVGWKAAEDRPGVADAYDIRHALAGVAEAKQMADLVIVMIHWGIERAPEPEPYQVSKAHALIDAGADLVIGSHPHVLQGLESYKGKWIAYSLGNFIFTVSGSAETRQSAMLQADCRASGECRLSVIPVVTGPGQPFYPDEEGAQAILDRLNRLSYQVRVNGDGTVEPDPSGRVYDPKWREKLMEPEAEAEYESESEAESESESEDQPATDTKEQPAADTNHEKETNAAAEREAGEDSYSL